MQPALAGSEFQVISSPALTLASPRVAAICSRRGSFPRFFPSASQCMSPQRRPGRLGLSKLHAPSLLGQNQQSEALRLQHRRSHCSFIHAEALGAFIRGSLPLARRLVSAEARLRRELQAARLFSGSG